MEGFGPKVSQFFLDHPLMVPAIPSHCPVGWDAIVREALDQLHELSVQQQRSIWVAQIKEKFAELRIYLDVDGEPPRLYFDVIGAPDGIVSGHVDKAGEDSTTALAHRIVERATTQSRTTCQVCGEPGRVRQRDWWATLCDAHARSNGGGHGDQG